MAHQICWRILFLQRRKNYKFQLEGKNTSEIFFNASSFCLERKKIRGGGENFKFVWKIQQ